MQRKESWNPLKGTRIVDFTFQGAGPHASMLLAFLGAEVIKIESETRPDPTRGRENRPYTRSLLFEDVNLSKRSLRLNMKHPEAVAVARRLILASDAVMDNFRPGVMERWGLSPSSLLEEKPSLVVASLSAAGSGGPLSHLPGYAGIFNAMGGLGELTGYQGGPPTELRTSVDMRVGAVFAAAVVLGLLRARATGRGCRIDLSAIEAVSTLIGEYLALFLARGVVPQRIGNRDEEMAPHGVYPCKGGGWLALAVRGDDEWRRLCRLMGRDDLAGRQDLAYVEGRLRNKDWLDEEIGRWTAGHETGELFHRLQGAGIAAAPVLDARLLVCDPHLVGRQAFYRTSVGGREGMTVGVPWVVDGERPQPHPAPVLGGDTVQVLEEVLGLSQAEIARLQESGALK